MQIHIPPSGILKSVSEVLRTLCLWILLVWRGLDGIFPLYWSWKVVASGSSRAACALSKCINDWLHPSVNNKHRLRGNPTCRRCHCCEKRGWPRMWRPCTWRTAGRGIVASRRKAVRGWIFVSLCSICINVYQTRSQDEIHLASHVPWRECSQERELESTTVGPLPKKGEKWKWSWPQRQKGLPQQGAPINRPEDKDHVRQWVRPFEQQRPSGSCRRFLQTLLHRRMCFLTKAMLPKVAIARKGWRAACAAFSDHRGVRYGYNS